MEPTIIALLMGAAFVGAAQNAIAGGGSFFTFPALMFAGATPIHANATSAVAIWPASIASALAFRKDVTHTRRELVLFGIVSLVGGLAGALLLLFTPEERFAALIPWLLGSATLIFAFGPRVTKALRARDLRAPLWAIVVVQFGIAIYGGYFGGGMGIMMLAAFSALGMDDLNAMNGLKHILATTLNLVANIAFIVAGVVDWHFALVMIVGAVAGGWFGGLAARRIDAKVARPVVVLIGAALTLYFFVR